MGLSDHLRDHFPAATPLPRRRRHAQAPPPLRPGDRVGVAALSGPVDSQRLSAGLQALADLGFEVVEATNLRSRSGLFAGDDRSRLEAFHALAADPTVRAIVFARGGHGVLRLLPAIDWSLLKRVPRAYVGYSDLTPFLLEVVTRLGLMAFHGPMVAADFARGLDDAERQSFLDTLAGRWPMVLPLADVAVEQAGEETGKKVIEGRILGGCLTMLTATLGTPHAPDLRDAILFVEEVDEPLYRLDRMLTHLRLSGTLTGVRALVFGHLTATGVASDAPAGSAAVTKAVSNDWQALVAREGLAFEGPVASGLLAGHQAPNLTVPLGAAGTLDPVARTLTVQPAARRGR